MLPPKVKKLIKKNWIDLVLAKVSLAAFILWIAKIIPPVLILEPGDYLTIAILAALRPIYSVLIRKK